MILMLFYILVYNLPLILTSKSLLMQRIYLYICRFLLASWEIIRSWLLTEAQQTIKFVDEKSITQFL